MELLIQILFNQGKLYSREVTYLLATTISIHCICISIASIKSTPTSSSDQMVVPAFLDRFIYQDSPFATARNTLTLIFSTSVELSMNVVHRFTILALEGGSRIDAQGNMSIPVVVSDAEAYLEDVFCDSFGIPNLGSWSEDNGAPTLEFFLCRGRNTIIPQSTVLTISFDVRNPASKQNSPAVRISADGPLFAVPEVVAKFPGTDLLGVTRGRDALEVEEPWFVVKEIGQSSPFAGERNELSVTLRTNVDLVSGVAITIAGLTPAAIISEVEVALAGGNSSVNALFCAGGDAGKPGMGTWDAGTLYLEVCVGATVLSAQPCELVFNITNPYWTQSSPDVSVSVNRSEPKGALIAPSMMQKPSTGTVDSRGCEMFSTTRLLGVTP